MVSVSVIVPVYNVEKYLKRCLNSIANQSYKDFEVILVDDGSTDNSGKICDEFCSIDNRFNVIHQENSGVSKARNSGIDIAKGEYLVFVDSDDEICVDYIINLMDSQYDSDLVVTGIKNIITSGELNHVLAFQDEYIEKISLATISQMSDNKSLNFVYGKRFKSEIIRQFNIRFDESMSLSEDTLFVVDYLNRVNTLFFRNKCDYRYYKYRTATLSSFNEKFCNQILEANEKLASHIDSKYGDWCLDDSFMRRQWSIIYFSLFYILKEYDKSKSNKIKLLHDIFRAKQFKQCKPYLEKLMVNDTKIIRALVQSGNAVFLYIGWSLIDFISKVKRLLCK